VNKNKKNKSIAIFLDSRKESGGEYQHLLYTLDYIKKNNKFNFKFIIISLSKDLDLNLEKKFNIDVKYFSLNSFERYLCYLRNHNSLIRRLRKYFFKNKFEIFLKKNNVDIVYFTSPSQYALYLEETKFLITVPDVDHRHHIEFPEVTGDFEFERKDEIFCKALPKALAVLTNAEIIKERLCYYYNLSRSRIFLISLRPALSIDNFVFDENKNNFFKDKYNLNKNFIYYPAMYLPHKNHKTVIDVIKLLKEKYFVELNAVFTGSDVGYKKNLLAYSKKQKIENLINFIDFVDDEALPYFYKNAFALVFPALIGPTFIPIWEAFKMEIPVVFSNLEGVKDLYGDAVIYVDPFDVDQIANAIINLKYDKNKLNRHILKGKSQLENMKKKNDYEQIFEIINNYRKIKQTWENIN